MIDPKIEEALRLLQEECGEVIIDASKICRFGFESIHPDGGDNNLVRFAKEVGDVLCLVEYLTDRGSLNVPDLRRYSDTKKEKLKQFSGIFDD